MEEIKRNSRRKMLIPAKLKIAVLIFASIVFLALLAFLVLNVWFQGTTEREITSYHYNHRGDLNYQVTLRDNLLYEEKVLEMGKVYPTAFVDQLLAKASYKYSGDKQGKLSGYYQVTVKIEGVQQEDKVDKILWSKEYLLVPETPFQSEDGQIELQKDLAVPFWTYNNFAEQVQQETGILSNVVLTMNWLIKTRVQTETGLVEEELTPNLSLPLCKKYFEIAGAMTDDKEGTLTEIVQQTAPVNRALVTWLCIGAFVCLLLILGLVFFMQGVTPNSYDKLVKQIFNKYEERFVALEKELPIGSNGNVGSEKLIRVKSVEDLVRIADEISRPVYYTEGVLTDQKGIVFYVLSDTKIFTFDIKPSAYREALQKKGNNVINSL